MSKDIITRIFEKRCLSIMNERAPLHPSKMSEEEFLLWLRSYFSTEQDPLVTLHKNIKKRRTSSHNQWKYDDDDDGLPL